SIEVEGASVLDEFYWLNKEDPTYTLRRATWNRGEPIPMADKMTMSPRAQREMATLFITPDEDLYDKKVSDVVGQELHYVLPNEMRRLGRDRKLDRKLLTRLAAVTLFLGCAGGPAYGGSVTQPGETIGAATGAPAPPGVYLVNTSDWGCRSTQPKDTCE